MKYRYIDIDEKKFEDEIIHWDVDDQITNWNVRCWIAGNECFVDGRIEIHEANDCCIECFGENIDEDYNFNYGIIYEIIKHTFKTKYYNEIINKINQAIKDDR